MLLKFLSESIDQKHYEIIYLWFGIALLGHVVIITFDNIELIEQTSINIFFNVTSYCALVFWWDKNSVAYSESF